MLEKIYTLDQIDSVAKEIIGYCTHKTLIFYGEMGSGKTTLIKNIIRQLGCIDEITSPTFSIVNEYQAVDGEPIFHFDFYRINNEEEVNQLGLDDYFNRDNWVFIEWPQNINSFLPTNTHSASLQSMNNGSRGLTVL